jgi:hypothetical protein
MPPRKPRTTPKKASESATPEAAVPDTASKKRKVNWSTIDEQKKPFEGFKLTAVKTKTVKKTSQAGKRQKTTKPATGVSEGYRDAPLDADIVQRNPFAESDLSQTHYKVTPAGLWESTLRYRKFTSKFCLSSYSDQLSAIPCIPDAIICTARRLSLKDMLIFAQSAKQSLKWVRPSLFKRRTMSSTAAPTSSTGLGGFSRSALAMQLTSI